MLSSIFERENFDIWTEVELKEKFDFKILSSYSDHHHLTYEEIDREIK